jgi:hypothetical protein
MAPVSRKSHTKRLDPTSLSTVGPNEAIITVFTTRCRIDP